MYYFITLLPYKIQALINSFYKHLLKFYYLCNSMKFLLEIIKKKINSIFAN